jgi:hypothetical protein
MTHISCFFTLFNNLVDSDSWWCNMNRKLSVILSLHNNPRTTREWKVLITLSDSLYSVFRCWRGEAVLYNCFLVDAILNCLWFLVGEVLKQPSSTSSASKKWVLDSNTHHRLTHHNQLNYNSYGLCIWIVTLILVLGFYKKFMTQIY